MAAKRARSAAVEKRPAFPATPPSLRAVGSCTLPRTGVPSSLRYEGEQRSHASPPGLKRVDTIPSGL